jgi:hypothetical protein
MVSTCVHASPSSVPEKVVSEQRPGICDQAEAETTSTYAQKLRLVTRHLHCGLPNRIHAGIHAC